MYDVRYVYSTYIFYAYCILYIIGQTAYCFYKHSYLPFTFSLNLFIFIHYTKSVLNKTKSPISANLKICCFFKIRVSPSVPYR